MYRGAVCCIGGPALVYYVQPTDEELFKRYNPELQKKSLERRYERQKEFDDFVNQLKDFSKDDRHSMRYCEPPPLHLPGFLLTGVCSMDCARGKRKEIPRGAAARGCEEGGRGQGEAGGHAQGVGTMRC